ncbi:alpha/beta hydrolase [Haliea atlantica]|jgi:pimeloyl-ACP methyl ester carboxylesterase
MRCEIDVAEAVGLTGPVRLVGELFPPLGAPKALVVCLPGGGCNRHYFDLRVQLDETYSLARTLARAGMLVLSIDHLGVGESSRPRNGYSVTIERVVTGNELLLAKVLDELRKGTLIHGLQATADEIPCVVVGHSMGAFLALKQQYRFTSYDGLALLGFGHGGMPDNLCDLGKVLSSTPERLEERQVELAKRQFGAGYVELPSAPSRQSSGSVTGDAYVALQQCRSPLISVPGAVVLVPGSVDFESRHVDRPVFLCNGARDIAGPVSEAAKGFPLSPEVTAMELPEAGHMHFIYESRHLLHDALLHWLSVL